ncbi:hypothetical protein P0D88_27820 [Paraburkholderia sp. RL18-103-BIB-C]|uniref:hypothetical protein n=1 Tax=unclassified Paraburkholderia TaxID=2615204 RepID=UPI002F605472
MSAWTGAYHTACIHRARESRSRGGPVLAGTGADADRGAHVNLSGYLGQTIAHRERLIVPTRHPSYGLRTADATLREDLVQNLVTAFGRAATLAKMTGSQ